MVLIRVVAVHAADAWCDILTPAFPGFFDPPWIGDQLSSDNDRIGIAAFQNAFRFFRCHDAAHDCDRYMQGFFYFFGQFDVDQMRQVLC